MEPVKTLHIANRKDWRTWLAGHYNKEKEAWLIYPKKASSNLRITYNDAVEEALCFGWIDSTVKSIDQFSYAQRFSPRKPKSKYSEANKQRLRRLVQQGLVIPSVEAAVREIIDEPFVIPPDILKDIQANKAAWDNFQKFSLDYNRIRIAFIEGARNRPIEFKKRLCYFIKMTEKNKQFGFGGIEKYY
jgi:uncharacterized protein YdeI (YjbR/CyaY-like superfamily)